MDLFNSLTINLVFLICLYFFFKKKSILIDNTSYSIHKKIGKENNSPILIGGLYLLFLSLFYFKNLTIEIHIILFLICVIGIMSDKSFITSAFLRFLLQLFLLLFIVYFGNLNISDLRIDFLNEILKNRLLNISLTIFCLAILLNGTNFIDGLNGLVVGYYILLLASLIFAMFVNDQIIFKEYNFNFIVILFNSLIFFFVLNIFGKVYMGDSGSYLIAIIIGIYLIKFYELNIFISPYYIALLLWYPAFENLFSLVRRVISQNKISMPDNMHLHQLIFRFLRKKKYFNYKMINSISSIIILLFNIPSFIFASLNIFDTKKILLILSINILVYCTVYLKIKIFLSNKN
jgi:UDP-N-acetylmuramyl pentapeptide phosphotransferase/UDP-N-acetylglucosamine-1-phosphate transferase